MLLPLVVACRVVANPLSNVFQKLLARQSAHPLFVILVTHALLSAVCLPLLPSLLHSSPTPPAFWRDVIAVALLTVAGNALLVKAVGLTDLSVLGPVNAYKGIISLLPGMVLLGEFPGAAGLGGMGLIVAGSYWLVDKAPAGPRRNGFVRFFTERGVQYRFAAMALAAVEAVFLKRALLASSAPLTFALWAVLGLAACVPTAAVALRGGIARECRLAAANTTTYLCLAASVGLMQFCTILVLGGLQVGYALALFQTSALLSVLLGHGLFDEKHLLRRLAGSAVMAAGAVVIVLGR